MSKKAVLYRMVTDEHICPYGIKSKDLLERQGYKVEDHHLKNREETDAFKEKHGVKTTPQTFIDEKRIGGHDDLIEHLRSRRSCSAFRFNYHETRRHNLSAHHCHFRHHISYGTGCKLGNDGNNRSGLNNQNVHRHQHVRLGYSETPRSLCVLKPVYHL